MHASDSRTISPPESSPPRAPSFARALAFWLKLGFISFGGPAGQIAVMHRELVEQRRWISERRFLHALNYCMLLPGPEAQQLATYIGWLMHRTWGGIVAGGLFVAPSLVILIALSWIYVTSGDVPAIAGVLYGVKPAVTAIVVFAAHRIGTRTLRNGALVAIAIAAFVAISAFAVPFPLIVLGAGIAGYIGGRVWPSRFAAGESHDSARSGYGAAVIDDDTPPPPHARFDLRHTIRVTFAGAALLLVPLALLALKFGWTATLTQMAWFFTKAALLTFGGAYAVLPYVLQSAVETYGWLTPAQVIDGLALGETTPGPLIMIVAFVGFVGSHAAALPGTVHPSLSGAAGACIATWFTFLPSFLFILIGGPLVEATHDEIRFTAPLTGVMAAVVGIIVNLAVFFAGHVLWPAGFAGRFEWPALVIGVGATIALMRRRIGVVTVVIGAGLCGLLWQAAR